MLTQQQDGIIENMEMKIEDEFKEQSTNNSKYDIDWTSNNNKIPIASHYPTLTHTITVPLSNIVSHYHYGSYTSWTIQHQHYM